ncbi:hypothetical protein QJQ45_015553 [Haematococcus lacustris]|nr:hypothetical protein QJQ45_015553 [Haematococcus lacustris]
MVELLKEERGHFAVLSLLPPENRGKGTVGAGGLPALVFAATTDFNTAVPEAVSRRLAVGQHLLVTIQKLASTDTGHRVLATIDLTRASDPAPPNNPAQGRRSVSQRISPGQMVSVSVTALHPTYVEVAVGGRRNLTGVVHMSEVRDLPPLNKLAAVLGTDAPPLAAPAPDKASAVKAEKKSGRKRKAAEAEAAVQQQPAAAGETAGDTGLPGWSGEGPLNPLAAFTVGQQLQAVVLPPAASSGLSASNRQGYMNLSIRPSVIAAAQAAVTSAASAAVGPGAEAGTTQAPSHTPETAAGGALPPANGELSLTTPLNPAKLSLGSLVCGVVSEVEDDHVWVSLSPYVKARLMLLDASPNLDLLPQPVDADANDAAGAGVQSPASPAGAKVPIKGGAFMVGQPLAAWVLKIQANKHAMDLTRLPGSVSAALAAVAAAAKVEKTRDSEGLQLLAAAHAAARAKKAEKTRDKGLAEAEAEASQVGVKPVASPAKEAEPFLGVSYWDELRRRDAVLELSVSISRGSCSAGWR